MHCLVRGHGEFLPEFLPGSGSVHQPGEDDCSIYRLQCCIALSVPTEQCQSVQSLHTDIDNVLHAVSNRQSAGDGDTEALRCRYADDLRQQWRRDVTTLPAAGEDYLDTF